MASSIKFSESLLLKVRLWNKKRGLATEKKNSNDHGLYSLASVERMPERITVSVVGILTQLIMISMGLF